mgnify:CR=1 FL=1
MKVRSLVNDAEGEGRLPELTGLDELQPMYGSTGDTGSEGAEDQVKSLMLHKAELKAIGKVA